MFVKLIAPPTSLSRPCLVRTLYGSLQGRSHFLYNLKTGSIVVTAGLRPQSPLNLHDNLQRESHIPYGPPTSVTWLPLPRQQTITGTSIALTAAIHYLRVHDFAHSCDLWYEYKLILSNVTCAWSWETVELIELYRRRNLTGYTV